MDSVVGTGFLAYAAADAGSAAGLLHGRALLLVAAGNIDPHSPRTFGPEFDQSLRTCFHTGAASGTLAFIERRESGFRIHLYRSEGAGCDTVTASQTAETAESISGIEGSLDLAGHDSVIFIDDRPVRASAGATEHRDHRRFLPDFVAEDGCDLFHGRVASDRAEDVIEVRCLYRRLGESVAAGKAATAAIGARHRLLDLPDTGILLNLEALGHKIQGHSKQQAQACDDCCGKDDSCSHNQLFEISFGFTDRCHHEHIFPLQGIPEKEKPQIPKRHSAKTCKTGKQFGSDDRGQN